MVSTTTSPASMPMRACELELADGLEDAESGANRALGVVLVRLRHPECGEDGVAGELLHDPAVGGTQCVTSSKNRVTRRRTISGSAALISSVEPTRSTNSTVASLRSIPEV